MQSAKLFEKRSFKHRAFALSMFQHETCRRQKQQHSRPAVHIELACSSQVSRPSAGSVHGQRLAARSVKPARSHADFAIPAAFTAASSVACIFAWHCLRWLLKRSPSVDACLGWRLEGASSVHTICVWHLRRTSSLRREWCCNRCHFCTVQCRSLGRSRQLTGFQ